MPHPVGRPRKDDDQLSKRSKFRRKAEAKGNLLLAELEAIYQGVDLDSNRDPHFHQHQQSNMLAPPAKPISLRAVNHYHTPDEEISFIHQFWRDKCQPAPPSQRSSIVIERGNEETRVQKLKQRLPDTKMYELYKSECQSKNRKPVSKTIFTKER